MSIELWLNKIYFRILLLVWDIIRKSSSSDGMLASISDDLMTSTCGECTGQRHIPLTECQWCGTWMFMCISLNKLLDKESSYQWFEITPMAPMSCDIIVIPLNSDGPIDQWVSQREYSIRPFWIYAYISQKYIHIYTQRKIATKLGGKPLSRQR